MRIKIATSHPLPSYKCWFAITEKLEKQTIHHLKRKLVRSLQLSQEPVQINLTIDDFHLLPQSKILDLVRDGDLVTIKGDHVKPASATSKKRKLVEEKEEKRAKKKKTDDVKSGKKASEDTKLNRSTDGKKEKKSSDKKASAEKKKAKKTKDVKVKKPVKEKKTSDDKQKEEEPKANKNKSLPFEGSKSTKARNLRRRLLKKHLREKQKNDTQPITNNVHSVVLENPEPAPIYDEAAYNETVNAEPEYVEPEYIEAPYVEPTYTEQTYDEQTYIEPAYTEQAYYEPEYTEPTLVDNTQESLNTSTKLIKKNKNKKKNHLKDSKAKNRSHQHFDKENEPPATKNLYGRAFITVAESEANPRTYQSTYEYPIHKMPTLFYAENPIIDVQENEPVDVNETVEDSMSMDGNVSEEEEMQINKNDMDKPVDYEKYPDADFVNNIPTVGNQLAIKTLELTANYTPEISEWKQVVLLELNLPESVTIEYKKGFGKASTKGGKFDNKKHQKRYYEEYEQEGELNEQEEEEEERVVTLATTDIFAVKNMS